jgi:hypothetical protein
MESSESMKIRCGEIEQMMATFAGLKGELDALRVRLVPLEDGQSGVRSVVAALHEIRDRLDATVERLDRDGDATLAERATALATTKRAIDERVAGLVEQFAKLDGMNKDMRALFAKLRGEVDPQLETHHPAPK